MTTIHAEIAVDLKERFREMSTAKRRKIVAELICAMEHRLLQWEQKKKNGQDDGTD